MARAKKPTSKTPALRAVDPARPVAPASARTLIGPQATKQPARPTRARKAPPPPPAVPRPAKTTVRSKAQATTRRVPDATQQVREREALDAVLAAPGDDAPRVAYAEVLRAHGDARGEFIAIGLELAMRGAAVAERDDPATKPLWDRFRELHARNVARWTRAVKALGKPTRWRWHRGFITELRIDGWDAGCTPTNLAAVLGSEPVVELVIEGGEVAVVAQLLALPGIERVRRLVVSGWSPQDGGAAVGKLIAGATRLTGVVELRAGIKLGDPGITALASARSLGQVVHLAIGAGDCKAEAFATLAASALGQRLEILEWLRDEITVEMAKVIVTMPSLRTFVGSTGHVAATKDILAHRFRDRFVVEDESGTQYLADGVHGVAHRPLPTR